MNGTDRALHFFPKERPPSETDNDNTKYSPIALVVNRNSIHFLAYVKGTDKQWIEANDESVRVVGDKTAMANLLTSLPNNDVVCHVLYERLMAVNQKCLSPVSDPNMMYFESVQQEYGLVHPYKNTPANYCIHANVEPKQKNVELNSGKKKEGWLTRKTKHDPRFGCGMDDNDDYSTDDDADVFVVKSDGTFKRNDSCDNCSKLRKKCAFSHTNQQACLQCSKQG